MRLPRWLVWFSLCACAGRPAAEGGVTTSTAPTQGTGALHSSCLDDVGVILETPDTQGYRRYANQGFTRYTEVVAPNGGTIPIFAQDGIRDSQLMRARNLLRFFLRDVPGSKWGGDKSDVANAMADNNAVLMMPNGEHEEGNEPNLPAQPLYEDETPADGSGWFMNNNYDHRDAAFEEIFHLVHDMGIGTWKPGVRPEYQADLDAEARAAMKDGRWGIPIDPFVSEWLDELEREDSLAQEYIASVIDSYYGLWGPWDEDEGGMWGIYIAKTREEIAERDPAGLALLEQFLPPTITTEIRLDDRLRRDFSMTFDASEPYTYKSQYFVHVTLTGDADVSLHGNARDNTLRGNFGDNTLDGAEGEDTVVYCGPRSDYAVTRDDGVLLVSGPDGADRLVDVEWVHFAGGRVAANTL